MYWFMLAWRCAGIRGPWRCPATATTCCRRGMETTGPVRLAALSELAAVLVVAVGTAVTVPPVVSTCLVRFGIETASLVGCAACLAWALATWPAL